MSENKALKSIQEQMNQELAGLAGSVAPPSSNKISLKGKVFTMPDNTTNQGPLRAVILDFINFNAYYKKAYDPQNPVGPDCFALHKTISEMSPKNHDGVPEPQSEDCATCPMNQFGSASTGKGKACRNKIRLAVVPVDANDDTEPMTIELPPSSIKSWNSYISRLRQQGHLPVQVVTDIAFDPNSPYPTLKFHASDLHDELEKFWALKERSQSMLGQPPGTSQ